MTDKQKDKLLDLIRLLGVLVIIATLGGLLLVLMRMEHGEHFQWQGVTLVALFIGIGFSMMFPDKFMDVLKTLVKLSPTNKD